jgi:electron transport complex protein RnfB
VFSWSGWNSITVEAFIENQFVRFVLLISTVVFLAYRLLLVSKYLCEEYLKQKSMVDRINSYLPQTQCGRCGYKGCLPYAHAISQGDMINKCPPGGISTILNLVELLNEPGLRLNPAHGVFQPPLTAVIREEECIGCTKCIQACPVDAILGAPKLMHTVITDECTGCDLCIEPCPVDCIDLVLLPTSSPRYWLNPIIQNSRFNTLETN